MDSYSQRECHNDIAYIGVQHIWGNSIVAARQLCEEWENSTLTADLAALAAAISADYSAKLANARYIGAKSISGLRLRTWNVRSVGNELTSVSCAISSHNLHLGYNQDLAPVLPTLRYWDRHLRGSMSLELAIKPRSGKELAIFRQGSLLVSHI